MSNTTLQCGGKPSDYFHILDSLRESGAMNMFGAPSWMVANLDISKQDAKAIFVAWTEQFGGAA